ncbi:hypothetical protein SRABI106_02808 [Rahnella aquatilis]|nr:hypothetical protein SRABI106_02808 [Rahnella aquatilis]
MLFNISPGGGRGSDPGFGQHGFVVIQIFGVEDPRHPPAFIFVGHGRNRAVKNLVAFFSRNTRRDILQQAVFVKFSRPDRIEQHHVITFVTGTACGDDFVVQGFIWHKLQVHFDIRMLFGELGGHCADIRFAVRRLSHK